MRGSERSVAGEVSKRPTLPGTKAGAPNAKARDRGAREGDPRAEAANPGRSFGAGDQVDDGPDAGTGAAKPR